MSETDNQAPGTPPPERTFSQKWTRALQAFTKPILKPFLVLSNHAATHPKTYVGSVILFSIAIMFIGLATNFSQNTDDDIWTPQGSKPVEHGDWVDDESNFPKDPRSSVFIVHRDGKNLFDEDGSMALESTQRMFQALDYFRDTPRYDELCQFSTYIHPSTNETACQIVGISTFWNDSTAIFEQEATSHEAVLTAMSAEYYPFGGLVDRDQVIGFNKFGANGILNSGQSYVVVIFLPADEDGSKAFSEDFEEDALDRMLELQDIWAAEAGNDFKLEIIAERSFEDEFERAVTNGGYLD